jgi:putative redox protein
MEGAEGRIRVGYQAGDRLVMNVRGHALFSDQPAEAGGEDTAPTPTEIFLAGLAGCVAFYAQRYLRRNGLDPTGLGVGLEYRWADNPHRVGEVELTVDAPGLPAERQEAFTRVIEHCAVHNTLRQPPAVRINLGAARTAAA